VGPGSPPPDAILRMAQKVEQQIVLTARRKRLLGETQLPNSIEFAGRRMVGVGGAIIAVDPKFAPLNFISELLVKTLGEPWFAEHLRAAENSATLAHPIVTWYRATMEWQNRHAGADGKVVGVLSGPARAWFLLGYDVWVLTHHSLLRPLLGRLRDARGFQGARYELTTYALFLRGGFTPERDDESDISSKHVEFIAQHRKTNERVAVEAKSRHRPGVLGFPTAGYTAIADPDPGITDKLRDALAQRRSMPYVICIEMNLPPAADKQAAENKFVLARAEIEAVSLEYSQNGERFPATLVVVTNYSHHYGDPNAEDPRWYQAVIQISEPEHPFTHAETLGHIVDALNAYGNLPKAWSDFDH
jgi:hypothetical protein